MQGYFEYKLFGTKEELTNALNKVKEMSKTEEDFKWLYKFKTDIKKSLIKDKYELCFGIGESGNISAITFLFDDMMQELCGLFKELEIEGTGYYLDCIPYPVWKSKAGQNYYEEVLESVSTCLNINVDEYIDKDGNIIKNTVGFECECCTAIFDILTKDLLAENGDWLCEITTICDYCGAEFEIELNFE